MSEQNEGIIYPPIDELMEKVDSKYALVLFSAKRARQINAYYAQRQEGLLENVGPLVTPEPNEKPLSIALREINEGKILIREPREEDFAAPVVEDFETAEADIDLSFDTPTEQ